MTRIGPFSKLFTLNHFYHLTAKKTHDSAKTWVSNHHMFLLLLLLLFFSSLPLTGDAGVEAVLPRLRLQNPVSAHFLNFFWSTDITPPITEKDLPRPLRCRPSWWRSGGGGVLRTTNERARDDAARDTAHRRRPALAISACRNRVLLLLLWLVV